MGNSNHPYREDGCTWTYTLDEDKYVSTANTPKSNPFGDVVNWKLPTQKRWWTEADKKRHETKQKRNMMRDPNHPKWQPAYSLLTWWNIKIRLLGSDTEGNQIIVINKGRGEPVWLKIGKTIQVYQKGNRLS